MRHLEKSIGRTGVLAIQPMLGMSHRMSALASSDWEHSSPKVGS